MSNVDNLHSADGSILGYLYQIEIALHWLSSSDSNASIGVEVHDDITVKLADGLDIHMIYEQAKHSQTSKIPYSDQSIDLWKTLSIWIAAVTSHKIDIENSTLSLFCNKSLPKGRLALLLSHMKIPNNNVIQGSEIEKAASLLKTTVGKLSKTVKPYGQIVLDCPMEVLIKVIDRVTVLDNSYDHNSKEMKKRLRNNLSLSDDVPFDYIYRGLFGFVSDNLIMSWKERKPGWITVQAFNQQYTQLVAEFKQKSFYERTVDSLPVNPNDLLQNRRKTYVEQLNRINCSENEVIEAIHDYLRAASERSRFAQEGEISKQKFDAYFDDLQEYWKSVSRPKFKFAKRRDFERIGYEVYYQTLAHRGKLNNYEPEQSYTHKGTYHFLSDEKKLGWHPQWNA